MTSNLNVDAQELNKFARLAATWWDKEGDLKTLHQVNPIRLGYIESKLQLKDKKILDVGCGGGILSESLSLAGGIVTGIDLNQSLIEVAQLHQLESLSNVCYLASAVEDFAIDHPGAFEVITCMELLEHVPDPLSIIKASATLLKPGGALFLSTLNRNPKSYVQAILGAEYMLKLLPKNTHDYAKFIKPSELCQWMRAAGLQPNELIGISYNPFTQHFKLNQNIDVNYLCYAIKPIT